METYAAQARFILTCNFANKVIPPLKSRCHEIHVHKTDQVEFTARAATVLVEENVEFELDTLDTYVRTTYPDLRKCLNLLQANSTTGKLVQPRESDGGTSDWRLTVTELFKARRIKEGRKLLCEQARPEEMEDVFRWMYDNLDLWSKTEQGQDEAIVIIRKGLVNHSMVGDAEINLSATMVELAGVTQ
jgi:DNA polymerase III delta prime subunit